MAGEKVLVIEDNPTNMELATALLEVDGYIVLQAESAEDGIELARVQRPDLILMDLGLPGMDGFTAIKHMREDLSMKGIPVIALTARALDGDETTVISAGFTGYLPKPFDTREFSKTIARFLAAG